MRVKTKRGMEFINPIGLSAGCDTSGTAIDSLFDLGFGSVEIGSCTPEQ
jgi:dihydroorotate dehydrogenase